MSATILGRARWLFSVMAVTVFSALVLVGCGEKDDDGGNIVCADGEAWVATIEGERLGFIPKADGKFIVIAHVPELNGWFGDVVGTWSTRGNNITLYTGKDSATGIYEDTVTGIYNVSGNSATITMNGETVQLTKQSGIRYELGYDIDLPWGDIVYEVKGGGGAVRERITGTINVHVRDGAGDKPFTSADDGVTVTLIAQGTRPQNLGANGAVSFTNLQPGAYEIRVQKDGYATSYYTAWVLIDETDINAGYNVNILAVLYKLDAELTGTLLYHKKDGTSAPAVSAWVILEVDLNRTRLDKEDYDVKIEERFYTTTVGPDGEYTFTGLPAVPGANYKVVSNSFSTGWADFEGADIFKFGEGPNLLSDTKVAAPVVIVSEIKRDE